MLTTKLACVVYKAVAEDEDLGLTCPLGPGRNIRCPCATTHYTIHHPLFRIHTTSGQVFVRTGVHLAPGGRYRTLIVAANANTTGANGDIMVAWGGAPGLTDHLVLTVLVQLPDTLNLLLFPPQRCRERVNRTAKVDPGRPLPSPSLHRLHTKRKESHSTTTL
ncbi:hypothetical protein Pcinc_020445 [Petrolisthes cinctipes]|uniref:Uncharacterized protein n=1 Tax=Petrolisthes cinctipes TaxID=88211 RepID=A0AAE1FJF8_PETCI|nr:hypothetical protein Pcinc_020445 [Petrolisthes cinctipes]